MHSAFITNRKRQRMAVSCDVVPNAQGLAFVMHGLGGFKEQKHIQTIADAFKSKGFTTILFDTTNTIGESEGSYEHATITNYYEDLENVIEWARGETWYTEPFILAGHSLGGICICLYAQTYPARVRALAPISTVVSGALSIEAHKRSNPEDFATWERTGWKVEESRSKPGVVKRLPWTHIIDRLRYDVLPKVSTLSMPVLLITGEEDTSTPPDHVRTLYDVLPGPKTFHIIPDAPHTFRASAHLKTLHTLISQWIDTVFETKNLTPPDVDEMIDIVNEDDEIVEQATRVHIHTHGLLHREIHIWLFTKQNEIIFQHRAKDKETFPDLLDATVGGHVSTGKTYLEAAVQEMQEEVGLQVKPSELISVTKIRNSAHDPITHITNNVWRWVYAYQYDGDVSKLTVERGEGIGFEVWPIEKILHISTIDRKRFVPSLLEESNLEAYRKISKLKK
ncbi:MAG TPA: alpha/beta fold hydrolase [Candidatus Woesebacteria bacterium]|nr:alpha/beta fold hydrolase [Candidatus Woesebacteria bacterium]HNS95101.1 alpha/beta fold hydrolase [Candidatus Woesebacteria bacterium]